VNRFICCWSRVQRETIDQQWTKTPRTLMAEPTNHKLWEFDGTLQIWGNANSRTLQSWTIPSPLFEGLAFHTIDQQILKLRIWT
jgi:hypothetical protein